uniref:Uncharacterized protein n=1 Tax=Zea mays TaxID=4577 RepID=A0A804Q3S0_MAIZE
GAERDDERAEQRGHVAGRPQHGLGRREVAGRGRARPLPEPPPALGRLRQQRLLHRAAVVARHAGAFVARRTHTTARRDVITTQARRQASSSVGRVARPRGWIDLLLCSPLRGGPAVGGAGRVGVGGDQEEKEEEESRIQKAESTRRMLSAEPRLRFALVYMARSRSCASRRGQVCNQGRGPLPLGQGCYHHSLSLGAHGDFPRFLFFVWRPVVE